MSTSVWIDQHIFSLHWHWYPGRGWPASRPPTSASHTPGALAWRSVQFKISIVVWFVGWNPYFLPHPSCYSQTFFVSPGTLLFPLTLPWKRDRPVWYITLSTWAPCRDHTLVSFFLDSCRGLLVLPPWRQHKTGEPLQLSRILLRLAERRIPSKVTLFPVLC